MYQKFEVQFGPLSKDGAATEVPLPLRNAAISCEIPQSHAHQLGIRISNNHLSV
jgi:hypothetical protein